MLPDNKKIIYAWPSQILYQIISYVVQLRLKKHLINNITSKKSFLKLTHSISNV